MGSQLVGSMATHYSKGKGEEPPRKQGSPPLCYAFAEPALFLAKFFRAAAATAGVITHDVFLASALRVCSLRSQPRSTFGSMPSSAASSLGDINLVLVAISFTSFACVVL